MFTVLTAFFLTLVIPFANVRKIGPEHHTLYEYTYQYRLSSETVNEFACRSLLDGIQYFDSKDEKIIPRQNWMKEKLLPDHWKEGTESFKNSCKNTEQLLEELKRNLNASAGYVLIRKRGCEVDRMPDGSVKSVEGVDAYGYNGKDFLFFDMKSMEWIARVPEAQPIKQKWDGNTGFNQYTKDYLEKECAHWLKIFSEYGELDHKEQLKGSPPPAFLFAKPTRSPDNLTLTCMITGAGLYPKEIKMTILKGATPVPKGNISEVLLPNGDGTYQVRQSVEVEKTGINYSCKINYPGLEKPIVKFWRSDGYSNPLRVIGAVGGGILVLLALGVAYKMGFIQYIRLIFNGCRGETEGPGPGNGQEEMELNGMTVSVTL